MDTDEMVRMAKEREGWEAYPSEKQKACVYDGKEGMEYGKAITGWGSVTQSWENANFIAHAPRTILALAERIRGLEAQLADVRELVDDMTDSQEVADCPCNHKGNPNVTDGDYGVICCPKCGDTEDGAFGYIVHRSGDEAVSIYGKLLLAILDPDKKPRPQP